MTSHVTKTRDILKTTLTGATVYSSGPLDAGDVDNLSIDINVTSIASGNNVAVITFSRIGNDNIVYFLSDIVSISSNEAHSISIGASNNVHFGDLIQIDLVNPDARAITATISIKGK